MTYKIKIIVRKDGDILLNVGHSNNNIGKGWREFNENGDELRRRKMAEGSTLEEIAKDDDMWVSYVKHSKVIKELAETKKQTQIKKQKLKRDMMSIRFKQWQSRTNKQIE